MFQFLAKQRLFLALNHGHAVAGQLVQTVLKLKLVLTQIIAEQR